MDASVRRAHTEDRRAQQALYEKEGFVGEGAFGVVMKAVVKQHTQTTGATGTAASQAAPQQQAQQPPAKKQYVAIKQMMNQREGQGISLDAYREIKILKELRHENIVSLERIFTRPDKHEVDLVYEYADHDLAEVIKSNRARMSQEHVQPDARFVKSVLQQILLGLAFLHGNWVMHRDLKPANILVTKTDSTASNEKKGEREAGEGGGVIKLADFGLARIFQSPLRKLADDGEVVTIWYRAPELLLGSKHYTRAIDIFAAGCIFFELLTCQPLFPGSEKPGKVFQENQVKEVFKSLGKPKESDWRGMVDCPHYSQIKSWPEKDYPFTLDARLPRQMSGAARDILLKMLAYDPGQRITAEQALAHPYFREDPKPMANVFKDANGGTIQVKVRETKPMNASKRGREAEAANGQAQQHHHQQQQQRMALQQVYHQAHLQQQSSQEAATATLAASSAAAAPSLQLPQAHSLARVGSYDPNGVPIMSQYQGMDGTSGGGGGGHGRSGSLQQFSQHPNTMLYGASSSVDMPPMLPAQAQAVISQRFNHLLAQNNTQGDKEMFERQLMQQVSGAGANANLQGPPAKVRKVD